MTLRPADRQAADPGWRRQTRQRRLVLATLTCARGFRTAQQLHAELRQAGHTVGLTTVYRTLAALTDSGDLDVVRSRSGECLYRRCDVAGHHHHLLCRICGMARPVQSVLVERWAYDAAAQHGFSEIDHTIELTGICSECACAGHRGAGNRRRPV